MSELVHKACMPLEPGTAAITGAALDAIKSQVDDEWHIIEGKKIRREFTFDDFQAALDFVNKAGALAEADNHHPDIFLSWGKATIEIWTHTVGGLSENDFILAAKIDAI